MAKQVLVDLNLSQNELQNTVIQNLATDPASGKAGQIYYNTALSKYKYYDGSTWNPIGEGAGTVTSVGVSNATNGGLTISGSPITSSGTISVGHSNVLTNAQTTSGIYPIKIDKNGHISEYGTALGTATTSADGLIPAFSSANKSSTKVASSDYVWDPTLGKYAQLPSTAFSDTTYTDGTAGYVLKAKEDKDGNQIDTTYAKLASPTFTGTPKAPTATAGTNTTQIATTAFVQTAVSSLAGRMTFKGTVGTGGTAGADLPTSGVKVGDTYRTSSAGTFGGQSGCRIGDLFIATATTPTWAYIPSGNDEAVTSITAGTGLTGGTITSTGTIALATSGVTAGTYQGITVDTYGRVTAATNMGYTTNTGTVTGITAGAGLNTTSDNTSTDGGTISTSGTLYLTKTAVTAGTYQGITVDKYGRVTGAVDKGYTTNIGTITKVQANGTDVASSGTANIPAATTSSYGVTELSSATNSTSEALAATPKAVKAAYDLAASKGTGSVTSVNLSNTGGLTISGGPITTSGSISIGHSNSVTAQATQAVYPIKIDGNGHISAYGSAVTILKKYSGNITGDGSTKNFTVTHSLGTRDVLVQVYDNSTYEEVLVDITRSTTAAVTIGFATAPASAKVYRVVVIG